MGVRFEVGDRVLVAGGCDYEPRWLNGGSGYAGSIRELTPAAAAVELDQELRLEADSEQPWQDFGRGSDKPVGTERIAHGRWLVLTHGWQGQTWEDPVRLHVGLCPEEPDLYVIPPGGGIGYWVESHADIRHA